jgi:predicted RNase H-like HicB family nuclease
VPLWQYYGVEGDNFMRKIDLKNVVWKEGKYYVAQCLNVDVSSFGKTKKEALSALDEALELYFEDIKVPRVAKIEKPELVKLSVCHV